MDTIHNYQTIVNRIKKKSGKTKVVISFAAKRYDRPDLEEKVANLNMELKTFCEDNLIYYVNSGNVDSSCLGRGKFHPNKKGNAYIAKNFIQAIKNLHCYHEVSAPKLARKNYDNQPLLENSIYSGDNNFALYLLT